MVITRLIIVRNRPVNIVLKSVTSVVAFELIQLLMLSKFIINESFLESNVCDFNIKNELVSY